MPANTKNKMYLKYSNTELYKNIKQDLNAQVERNGTANKYYTDFINDYMDMWTTKCLLIDDIKKRGVSVRYENGGGQKGIKKNESVEQLLKINAQMLRLLAELGIKPSKSDGGVGGNEEM